MYRAIDVHGHFGDPECFPQKGKEKNFLLLSAEQLKRQYESQEIAAACLSPMEALFPYDEATLLRANDAMAELAEREAWVYPWVVVDPLFPKSYQQAEELLSGGKCVGVKIHPDANGYPVREYLDEIFAFCHERGAILESHSGDPMSMPEEFVPFADRYPDVSVIVAHLGYGCDQSLDHQVNAVKSAKNGNIYTDVSSAKSILNHLIEWAVKELPAGHILFGTDTPLHHVPMMKQRIEFADISEEEKSGIFYQNAQNLFGRSFEI